MSNRRTLVASSAGGVGGKASSAPDPTVRAEVSAFRPTQMLLSLVTWVAFTFILSLVGAENVGWAAAAALVIAVGFLRVNLRSGLKILDATSVATFAVLTLVAVTGGPAIREVIADYGRGGCALVLGLVMAISAMTVPFTEQYARESVPRRLWGSPAFRAVNRKLSATWAGMVLVMAASHLLDGYLDATMAGSSRAVVDGLLNWALPIGVVVLGIHITKSTIAAHHTSPSQQASS